MTEPTTGLDTTKLKTRAVRQGDRYVVHGQKVWISTAQIADKILLLARTTPLEEVKKPTEGLSLFYTDLDRTFVTVREIEKMGRKCVDSNELFIDGLPIPAEDLIGEEGQGFRQILHGLNPERVLIAAEAVGIGRNALRRAADYANERVVFGRPIGQNQGVQHPLAACWAELEAANLMAMNSRRALRCWQAVWKRSKCGQIPGKRSGGEGDADRAADIRRFRICQGIPCRASGARSHPVPHRAGHTATGVVVHCGARAWPAEILLIRTSKENPCELTEWMPFSPLVLLP